MNLNTIVTIGWENKSVQISLKKVVVYFFCVTLIYKIVFTLPNIYLNGWNENDLTISVVFLAILFAYSCTIK